MTSAHVVVVGDLMVDIVAVLESAPAHGSDAPARIRTRWGGSGANTAAWLAASGTAVTFVGRVGDDYFGRAAVEELAASGVEPRVGIDPERPTGTCIVLVHPDGERSMLPDAGANSGLGPAHLPSLIREAHLHLSGYTLLNPASRAAGQAALKAAWAAGMSTSVDASSAAPLAIAGADAFLDWTRGVDLLFANADEARVLSGDRDPLGAGRALAGTYHEVVVKLGASGALWCGPGRDAMRIGGARTTPAVDTTGAGDAFAAGFLGRQLTGGRPAESLTAGAALASRAVAQLGARPSPLADLSGAHRRQRHG